MQKGLDFVREQSGSVPPPDPGVPGIPPRRLPTGIGDWNGTDGFSGIQTLAWRTIDLSARTKPTIGSRQR